MPHATIEHALDQIKLPEEIRSFVMHSITECTTTIKTSSGATSALHMEAGVKQGCPLSPLIFNLVFELGVGLGLLYARKKSECHSVRR